MLVQDRQFNIDFSSLTFMTMTAQHSVVVALVALASITDVRTRRIPNVLTFGATIAALLFHVSTGGTSGLTTSVGGWMLGAALFFPVFALRGMGAGDVKLLAAMGWLARCRGVASARGSARCRSCPWRSSARSPEAPLRWSFHWYTGISVPL